MNKLWNMKIFKNNFVNKCFIKNDSNRGEYGQWT